VDPMTLNLIAIKPDEVAKFEPKGKVADEKKLVMGYVVAYDSGSLPCQDMYIHQAALQKTSRSDMSKISLEKQRDGGSVNFASEG